MKDQWMPLLDQTVIALLNGVLQGLLLTVFVWVMLRIFRKINASTRYLIWMGTLGCLAAFPLIHFLLAKVGTGQDVQAAKNERFVPTQSMIGSETHISHEALPAEELNFAQLESFNEETMDPTIELELPLFAFEIYQDDQEQALTFENTIEQIPSIETEVNEIIASQTSSNDPIGSVHQEVASSLPQPEEKEVNHAFILPVIRLFEVAKNFTISTRLPQWPVLLLLGFFVIGATWNTVKLAYDLWLLRRLKKEAILPNLELNEMFQSVSSAKGNRSGIALRVHPKLKTPLAVGFFQPLILMPETLANRLNDSAKKQILKHELAHLLRYDDWTNLYQRLIQAFYFFHPAVWLVSRRADVEREIACDDHVLDRAGQAKSYALMLTQFANRERDRHLASASAVWNKQSQIKERIEMLLDHHRNTAPRPARLSAGLLTTAALIVAALTLQYGPRVALADDPASANSAESATDSNSIFDSVVDEPRSKNDTPPPSGFPKVQTSELGGNPSVQSFPSAAASSKSSRMIAPQKTKPRNPFQNSGGFSQKSVLAADSGQLVITKDAVISNSTASSPSSGLASPAKPSDRLPRLRPVPGTSRVEVVHEPHRHPVEIEIISDHAVELPHVDPVINVTTHSSNPLERRIAKLENLVQELLKTIGDKQAISSERAHRTAARRARSLSAPESGFGHEGGDHFKHAGDDLFEGAPGMGAQLSKPNLPGLNRQKIAERRILQRAHELEQKRHVAEQTRAEIEKQREHLEGHMESLKEEMAKLEREMRALEMKAKEQKRRQSFNNKPFGDAFSSDKFEESFEEAFDAYGEGNSKSVY